MSYALIRITDPADWQDYHDIRRSSLWAERGLTGYDDARPEERLPNHHSLLLKFEGRAIGTTRLDDHLNSDGIIRLVAVTAAERKKGHGRVLNARVERYALKLGIKKLFVSAAREAEGFYVATGWTHSTLPDGTDDNFVAMEKTIIR